MTLTFIFMCSATDEASSSPRRPPPMTAKLSAVDNASLSFSASDAFLKTYIFLSLPGIGNDLASLPVAITVVS